MKIYTKVGDHGRTGLLGGGTCGKEAVRIEAVGSVDELNCQLGRLASRLEAGDLRDSVIQVQNWLFEAGAELASPDLAHVKSSLLSDDEVKRIESWIDGLEGFLTPLTTFILPGGSVLGAEFHMARAICRRAERRIGGLSVLEAVAVRGELLRFFNRLSEWLFVAARFQSQSDGEIETPWVGSKGS